jgi:hypothetical protein
LAHGRVLLGDLRLDRLGRATFAAENLGSDVSQRLWDAVLLKPRRKIACYGRCL